MDNKPWEFRVSDIRKEDSLVTFNIFCEDEVSECIYLKSFETTQIKINIIGKQGNNFTNISNTLTYCCQNGILEYDMSTNKYNKTVEENIHIWCVYDRDTNLSIADLVKNDLHNEKIKFEESINLAKRNGINVAWSNDAFELWVLLHFKEIDISNNEYMHRDKYYSELTEYLANHPSTQEFCSNIHFNYKDWLKSERNFRYRVKPLMLEQTQVAIDRARQIDSYHISKEYQYDRSPSTKMYELIEELLNYGNAPE